MSLLDASLVGAASVAVSAASLMATAVFHPRVMVFGPGVWKGPARQNVVALTFDDGPHPHYTARIAEVLAKHGARATFFCIGRELERHASLAHELLDAGHELENHTYQHNTGKDLFSASRLEGDLERCQQVFVHVTGARARYYRPAVGVRNPAVHEAARRVGMTIVTWTHAARDGVFRFTPKRALSLAERAGPGSILALHDGISRERSPLREHTLQQLPLLLSRLRERGFGFVTLRELLSS